MQSFKGTTALAAAVSLERQRKKTSRGLPNGVFINDRPIDALVAVTAGLLIPLDNVGQVWRRDNASRQYGLNDRKE